MRGNDCAHISLNRVIFEKIFESKKHGKIAQIPIFLIHAVTPGIDSAG
jgi:hypothetical protein